MKTIKLVIFLLSLFLINYVGGMPTDLKNLFITHTIFFTPYFLELHQLLRIKFDRFVYFIIRGVYGYGVFTMVCNILGIFGIIKMDVKTKNLQFNEEYWLPFHLEIGYDKYILIATIAYVFAFVSTIMFSHMVGLQKNADKVNVTPSSKEQEAV